MLKSFNITIYFVFEFFHFPFIAFMFLHNFKFFFALLDVFLVSLILPLQVLDVVLIHLRPLVCGVLENLHLTKTCLKLLKYIIDMFIVLINLLHKFFLILLPHFLQFQNFILYFSIHFLHSPNFLLNILLLKLQIIKLNLYPINQLL